MKWTKRPCRVCRREVCEGADCGRWQTWFLDAWGAVNQYAWARVDEAQRRVEDKILVGLPHETPCMGCSCAEWCDTPCARRLLWWDMVMQRKKQVLGGLA